jgi:hypothetical protein
MVPSFFVHTGMLAFASASLFSIVFAWTGAETIAPAAIKATPAAASLKEVFDVMSLISPSSEIDAVRIRPVESDAAILA